jgi:hypothetical protein
MRLADPKIALIAWYGRRLMTNTARQFAFTAHVWEQVLPLFLLFRRRCRKKTKNSAANWDPHLFSLAETGGVGTRLCSLRQVRFAQQFETQRSLQLGPKGVRRRKDEGGKDQIKDPDPEIAEPPPERRKLAPPSRPAELPDPDEDQAAYEYYEGQLISPAGAGDPPSRRAPHTDIYSNRPRTDTSHCHGH